jgi:hypothetical protein
MEYSTVLTRLKIVEYRSFLYALLTAAISVPLFFASLSDAAAAFHSFHAREARVALDSRSPKPTTVLKRTNEDEERLNEDGPIILFRICRVIRDN